MVGSHFLVRIEMIRGQFGKVNHVNGRKSLLVSICGGHWKWNDIFVYWVVITYNHCGTCCHKLEIPVTLFAKTEAISSFHFQRFTHLIMLKNDNKSRVSLHVKPFLFFKSQCHINETCAELHWSVINIFLWVFQTLSLYLKQPSIITAFYV